MRTVIVSGGTRGIGAAIVRAFHAAGERVLLTGRTDRGLAAALGDRARFAAADVLDIASHARVVQAAIDWSGRLDVFVACAGESRWSPVGKITEEIWDAIVDTNLKGTFFGCQAAAARLPSGGCIVTISSLAGKRGSANNAMYCAAKFGVNGLTQALAKELGPRGIRVNAVCPVYVRTPGLMAALAETDSPAGGGDVEAYLTQFAAGQAALGRLPLGEEIAQACVFLASPAASAITGQCINVDCGVLPQ